MEQRKRSLMARVIPRNVVFNSPLSRVSGSVWLTATWGAISTLNKYGSKTKFTSLRDSALSTLTAKETAKEYLACF